MKLQTLLAVKGAAHGGIDLARKLGGRALHSL